mgnify:CR=1 FL=1
MIRLYIFIFIATTALTIGYSGYNYVMRLQDQVVTLKENNALLEQTVATNQETITRMNEEAVRNAELQSQLQGRLQEAQERVGSLRTRLSQIDITREALTDPVDMEERINRGVQRLRQRLLEETGGEVVDNTDIPASAE